MPSYGSQITHELPFFHVQSMGEVCGLDMLVPKGTL